METHISFNEALADQSKELYVSGPNLCKFYSRPVNSRVKAGDVIEIEHESKTEEPLSLDKEICDTNLTTVGTQTDFRESETQTDPWDPPFVVKRAFKNPEVLHLKELTYGKGLPVTQTEIDYILESKQNRDLDIPSESIVDYETFSKKKQLICSQVKNEWNYKITKHSGELLDKLKLMETALAQELAMKSERQERLLKNLWTQKRDKMSKVNSKLKKELNKEIKVLEKKYKDGDQRFEPKAYGVDKTAKKIAVHIDENKESLNRDIDHLISKYHMNPNGLSKLTGWLERKRTLLYNEVPTAKPFQKSKREKVTEKAYSDLLASKHTAMPPKVYHEDFDHEESKTPEIKSEVKFEVLKLPEEGIDLVTVWQQVLRGRAYQKQVKVCDIAKLAAIRALKSGIHCQMILTAMKTNLMLELIAKHKDTLDVLLPSQIKL